MKKTLSFVLALLVLVTVMPFAVSAAEDFDIYGPNELDGPAVLAMTGLYGAGAVAKLNANNNVYHNVNMFTSRFAILARPTGKDHYNFHDNIYFMEEGKFLGGICEHPESSTGEFKMDVPYTKEVIETHQANGYEEGSKFYVTEKDPYGDMYKLCIPE